jgi:hypothetical protein
MKQESTTMAAAKMTEAHLEFLSRFVARGWLHATRNDKSEQDAVDAGLRKRYLRRELGEAHFTPSGQAALTPLPSKTATA